MSHQKSTEHNTETEEKLPFWKMVLSVFQASFGVQNKTNKERDFAKGSIKGFIAAVLIFMAVFIVTIVTIVSIVLP